MTSYLETGHVLFGEWDSGRTTSLVETPGPCPVCGTRMGLCTHDRGREVQIIRTAMRNVQERIRRMSESKKEAADQADFRQAKPAGTVIPAEEEATIPNLRLGAVSVDDLVAVTEDVWQEYYQEGSKRPSYRLVASAGTVISKSHLEKFGSNVKTGDPGDTAVHDQPAGHPLQTDALNPTDEKVAKEAEKAEQSQPKTQPAGGTQRSGRSK